MTIEDLDDVYRLKITQGYDESSGCRSYDAWDIPAGEITGERHGHQGLALVASPHFLKLRLFLMS